MPPTIRRHRTCGESYLRTEGSIEHNLRKIRHKSTSYSSYLVRGVFTIHVQTRVENIGAARQAEVQVGPPPKYASPPSSPLLRNRQA